MPVDGYAWLVRLDVAILGAAGASHYNKISQLTKLVP